MTGPSDTIPAYIPERWHSKIKVEHDDKGTHYLWTGWNNGEGHAKAKVHGCTVYIYRWLYERITGRALRSDEHIDHTCERKPCLNFLHWEPVPPKANTFRGAGRRTQYRRPEEYALFEPTLTDDEVARELLKGTQWES
jgi:hypothetical protein